MKKSLIGTAIGLLTLTSVVSAANTEYKRMEAPELSKALHVSLGIVGPDLEDVLTCLKTSLDPADVALYHVLAHPEAIAEPRGSLISVIGEDHFQNLRSASEDLHGRFLNPEAKTTLEGLSESGESVARANYRAAMARDAAHAELEELYHSSKNSENAMEEFRRYFDGVALHPTQLQELSQPDLAVLFYQRFADQNNSVGQYHSAMHSIVIAQDYKRAIPLLEAAISQGHIYAQLTLAEIHKQGIGSEQRGIQLMESAAERGNVYAQYQMGEWLFAQNNLDEAVRWFEKAALNGFPDAQYMFGLMYLLGEGVEHNLSKAISWYQAAAEWGHEGAKRALEKLQIGQAVESTRNHSQNTLNN